LDNRVDNQELAKRFLLGSVTESEREQIEDGFLAQADLYQELLMAEDDLIDAYVRGELPARQRALFEQRCLTSQRDRERVEFARTLFNSVSGRTVPARVSEDSVSWWASMAGSLITRRPALGFAFAAALLVFVLGGLWFLTDNWRTRPTPEQAKSVQPAPATPRESSTAVSTAEQPQLTSDLVNYNQTPAGEGPKRTAPVIATFTLLPGLVRGEGAGALAVPAGATEVRLRLTLDAGPYQKYRATLSTPEGRKIWSQDVVPNVAKGRASTKSNLLTLGVPADLLKSGDYVLDLSGANATGKWESVADYSFRIVKK